MTDGQTPTLTTVSRVDVANSVLRMLSLCKVCATRHVAAFYAHTNRPFIRAWEVLHYLRERDYVESYRAGMNKEATYRLSRRIRKQYGIIPVRWNSSVMEHRLAITDVYVDLGEPETFVTEYRSEFDWRGRRHVLCPDAYAEFQTSKGCLRMFIEVQRTPIESKRWSEKRMQYEAYYVSGMWQQEFETKPVVVVVMPEPQLPETIGSPIGYEMYIARHISEVMALWES